jgi:two-component system sensor histidine kinase HydH
MSEEHQKKVFAPFFTTKLTGTGLGLALVQQIATEHGGRVECDSSPGKGTTFTIFLPTEKTS